MDAAIAEVSHDRLAAFQAKIARYKALEAKERCEESLAEFFREAWPVLDSTPYQPSWAIDAMCDHLEAVTYGHIRRLLINIPPRCSKPISQDALILTKRGLLPLSEVGVGDYVWTHKGRWRVVTAVHEQGYLPVFKITTRTGREVEAAADHPFLTPDGWRNVGDLSAQDVLGLVPLYPKKDVCGNSNISEEEARLLGYLVGDGHCSGTPNITTADDIGAADIMRCARSLGFDPKEYKYKITKTTAWLRRISLRSIHDASKRTRKGYKSPVKVWLAKHSLEDKSSYTKMVPISVLCGSNSVVSNFIGAYWSCDGYVTVKGPKRDGTNRDDLLLGCDSVNKDFLLQMQMLLLRIGVNSRVSKKVANIKTKRQGDFYTSWRLVISTQDDIWRFCSTVEMFHEKYNKILSSRRRRFDFDRVLLGDVIESVQPAGNKLCRCLTVAEDAGFTANGFAVHNTTLCSIAYPAWVWCRSEVSYLSGPQVKFLCASYGHTLSLDSSNKSRRLLFSPWYQKLWADKIVLRSDQNTKMQFDNNAGGSRIATSVGGSLIGLGGDILIADDLNKVSNKNELAETEAERNAVAVFWSEFHSTRLNNPKESAVIVVQQRLHEQDVSGLILDSDEEFVHLCYDADTEILTEIGWIRFSELTKGTAVMGVNPQTLEASWEKPYHYTKEPYQGKMLHYKSLTADLLVTPDHRMIYGNVNDMFGGKCSKWRVRPANKLPSNFYLPQIVSWIGTAPERVLFGGKDWESSNFVEFMGWYLSEGCTNSKTYATRIVQHKLGLYVGDIDRVMAESPLKVNRYNNRVDMICWHVSNKILAQELEPLGKSLNKRAPPILKELSPELLRKFLLAYAKGDGSFSKKNSNKIIITTASEQMANDLQECAIKAGWSASLNKHKQRKGQLSGVVYRVYLRVSKAPGCERKIASKIRKENISSKDYTGYVYCVSVPSTAVVVRRNGRVSVSGNCIPMEYESGRTYSTVLLPQYDGVEPWDDPRTEDGELMWPERFGATEIRSLKAALGPYMSAGRLQQSPSPKGGGIIKRDWWQLWGNEEARRYGLEWSGSLKEFPHFDLVVGSLDTSYGEKQENDFNAFTVWGLWTDLNKNRRAMLMFAWNKRLPLHGKLISAIPNETRVNFEQRQRESFGLIEWVTDTCKRYRVQRLLIENKTRGRDVANEIIRLYVKENWGVQLVNPVGDKVARTHSVVPLFVDGAVYAPETRWSEAVLTQCQSFPKAAHDDLHDTVTQFLLWARDNGLLVRGDEMSAALEDGMAHHASLRSVVDQYGLG